MVEDCISREALLDRVDESIEVNHLRPDYVWFTPNEVKALALEIPAADVVERRTGHFGKHTSPFTAPCSECGTSMNTYWHYCPNCGAIMDGGQDE